MARSAGNRDEFRSGSWQDLLVFPMWDMRQRQKQGEGGVRDGSDEVAWALGRRPSPFTG